MKYLRREVRSCSSYSKQIAHKSLIICLDSLNIFCYLKLNFYILFIIVQINENVSNLFHINISQVQMQKRKISPKAVESILIIFSIALSSINLKNLGQTFAVPFALFLNVGEF